MPRIETIAFVTCPATKATVDVCDCYSCVNFINNEIRKDSADPVYPVAIICNYKEAT